MGNKVVTATKGGVSDVKGRVITATTEKKKVAPKRHELKRSKVAVVGGMPEATEVKDKVVSVLY